MSAKEKITAWMRENQAELQDKKARASCIAATGLGRSTVYSNWDAALAETVKSIDTNTTTDEDTSSLYTTSSAEQLPDTDTALATAEDTTSSLNITSSATETPSTQSVPRIGRPKSDKTKKLTIVLTPEDNRKLRRYALEHEIGISDLIAAYISSLPDV